jgi:hypothetical protein
MKLTKVLLLGVAAFSLAACSGGHGTKVDEKAFIEEAQKCEDKTFSKATLSYSYTMKQTVSGTTTSASDKGSYTFTNNNGTYVLDDNQTVDSTLEGLDSFVGINVKVGISDVAEDFANPDYKIAYYKAPLGFSATMDVVDNDDDTGMKMTAKTETYLQFDQYGYFTKATYTMSEKMSMKSAGVTISANVKMTLNITVSYK